MHGPYVEYYENGNIKKEFIYLNGEFHGPYVGYYENGNIRQSGTYKKNIGWINYYYWYNEDGTKAKRQFYEDGKAVGKRKYY